MKLSACLAVIPRRAFVLFGVCSALFFLLAADVRYHGVISRMDRPISQMLHERGAAKMLFLRCATELGDGGVVERFAWALAGLLILIRRWHYLPMLFLAVLLGERLNVRMQVFFGRSRPHFEDVPAMTHPGFPSGHVAGAVLVYGFLIVLAVNELRNQSLKIFSVSFAILCILLVGVTRIGLLAHYPTDVLGSFCWCTAWLMGCYYGNIVAFRWSKANAEPWGSAQGVGH